MWALGDGLLLQHRSEGQDVTPWQLHGYRGWSSGAVKLASRTGSVILSLSSSKCSQHWKQCLAAAENCSRLDLAVDVDLDHVTLHLASHLYKKMQKLPPVNGRPVKSAVILNSDWGNTLYIGSRQSDLFARCYDKGVEQATAAPGKWYRFELEVKGDRSLPVARALQSAVAYPQQLLSMVAHYFMLQAGILIPSIELVPVCNWRQDHTTVDQSLQWLSSQVRPTVQRLLDRGLRSAVLDALRLR